MLRIETHEGDLRPSAARLRATVARSRDKGERPCLDHVQGVHRHRLDKTSDCAGGDSASTGFGHPFWDGQNQETAPAATVPCFDGLNFPLYTNVDRTLWSTG